VNLGVTPTGKLTETVSEVQERNLEAWLDLYWLPLGAGGNCVRFNGRFYERILALRERRQPSDLYHSALQLRLDNITYAIEMGPVWNIADPDRGAVCQGPVGAPWLGRFRAFQYEVRCAPATCGTQTRWWRGRWRAPVTTWPPSSRQLTGAPQDGKQD